MFSIIFTTSLLLYGVFCQNAPPIAHFYQQFGENDHIPEDTPPGTAIYYINASDPDSPADSLYMQINSNTFKFRSDIDSHVLLFKSLNFEASTTASFALTVSDGESDTLYNIDVAIDDVNDVQPKFSQLRYQSHIPEDAPVGSLVFADVTVNDRDVTNSDIEVVCTRNQAFPEACNLFYVDTTLSTNTQWKGNIYLQQHLDFETMPEAYQLHLTAMDGNPNNNYLMNFEIIIVDVTDAPPRFTSRFDTRIKEDVPQGTFVLAVQAVDGDAKDQGTVIVYSFVENPGQWFNIDSLSGNITTARPLDRNSPLLGPQGNVVLVVTAQELQADGSRGNDSTTQSFTDVTITIIDVNNHPPSFGQTHYSAFLPEDLENGQAIPNLTMNVQDEDGMDNAYFKFVFSGLRDYEDVFRVSPPEAQGSTTATIVIQNSSAIDYDRGTRQYTLEVIAKEVRTDSNLSSTAIVTIYLQDANDNKPQFDVELFRISDLSELTQPGEFIASLPQATDIDTGLFGTSGIVYSLIGFGNNRFELDPLSADLKLRRCSVPGSSSCLDYETVKDYELTLIATDNNGTGHETRLPIIITILDENDNVPEFTQDEYEYRIEELTTRLVTDQEILATDEDSSRNGNNRIRYSLVTDRLSLFNIDPVSAELTVNRPIAFNDGDANGRLSITVGAGNLLDGVSRVDFTRNVTVHIVVEDVNDNAPYFVKNYTASILENIRPDTQIVQVRAEDDDYGRNAAVEYSIISGAANTFEIDIDTGVITRKNGAVLDFDERSQYQILVRATDKGNPRRTGDTFVVINIIDNNDRNPIFNPPSTHVNVSEDAAIDSLVVSMQAIDLDVSAVLRYSLIQPIEAYDYYNHIVNIRDFNYTDLFRIDSSTGQVFVNNKLDINVVKRIVYTVQAIDIAAEGPIQVGTGTLHIDIINANTNPPIFRNVDRVNNVYEEQPVGSVVMVLTAFDDDRDLVFYDIWEESVPGVLSVHPTTGLVTVAGRIDYEVAQVINFTARARDEDSNGVFSHTTFQQFTINVLNINDNLPTFSKPYYVAQLQENVTDRQLVVNVFASDLDLPPYGVVMYGVPPDSRYFRIDERSGAIYKEPGAVLDREQIKGIQLPVVAYDGPGVPSRSATTVVYIDIQDVNDNQPYFLESDVYVTLPNDIPVGSVVTNVYAFDDDFDDRLTYSISGSVSARYEVEPDGVVRTSMPLTNAPDETFDVRATDRAGHYATIHVHVTIIGNKNGPMWVFPAFDGDKIVICENQLIGVVINRNKLIYAVGADSYSFLINGVEDDDLDGDFRLVSDTGEIITKSPLDRERRDSYLVQVLARDANGLTSQRYLRIEICDENDNPPEFPTHSNGTVKDFHFYIASGVTDCVRDPSRNNECGVVTAYDLDLPVNALIMYSLTGGDDDEFVIDPSTGVISSIQDLDYEVQSVYRVEVTANNYRRVNGRNVIEFNRSPRGRAYVYIHVLPPDANVPLIKDQLNLYTSIDTQVGRCLDSVRPAGLSVDVTYTLTSSNLYNGTTRVSEQDGQERFDVARHDGNICTIRLFNYNNIGHHYRLQISVESTSGRSESGVANIWLTSNIHKIRIVINGDTTYVNNNRALILDALQRILGTNIVWIDSIGHYTSEGSIDTAKSEVIIYAVHKTTRLLFVRNVTTVYINKQIAGDYKSIALTAKILRAEDVKITYIYLASGTTAAQIGGGGAVFPTGLLVAMLLLLPLLLLPFLLCCLACCPCCASLLGGKKGKGEKYVVLGGAGRGYQEGSYIDEWYEQSKVYNNPAYDANWDSGSAHMLVGFDKGQGQIANGIRGGGEQETIEETEEYYRQNISGGDRADGDAQEGSEWSTRESQAQLVTGRGQRGETAQAASAVIVDTLTPAAATGEEERVVVEEERTEHRTSEESRHRSEKMEPLLTTTDGEHHQMSSLSPATIDILDSASAYNAKVRSASRPDKNKYQETFSHTATVPRYGGRYLPESDEYVTSQSYYESDYHSSQDQRPQPRYRREEEAGMTIILDAEPTVGMEAENVEYEVLNTLPASRSTSRSGYVTEQSGSYRRGTIPRNGFTIELEPNTGVQSGMVADREEYVLTDDEGLAPEFFAEAPTSPKQQKRYKKKTVTKTVRGANEYDRDDQY